MKTHPETLRSFARKLSLVLMLRGAVRWVTLWFFVWGVVVLAARFTHAIDNRWLLPGLLGAAPVAALAAWREHRRRADFARVRAAYDHLNRCGGVIMAGEAAVTSGWEGVLPAPAVPVLRWRSGRVFGVFGLSSVFVAVALLLPERMTTLAAHKPLEIGKLAGELKAEIEVLKEENILEEEKAGEMERQLNRLEEKASATDPNKTWEALDHMKESNAELARQAAEEVLAKTASLTEAETLARALAMAMEAGLADELATRAAQDLAAMLQSARLEEGLLDGRIPPELLSQLDGLSKEDLEKLAGAMQFNKAGLGKSLTNLAKLKLIDPKKLSQCNKAGRCPNPDALAAFLCQNTNGCDSAALALYYCRGGVNRGRADAPMTWKDESSEQGAKFKEESLPEAERLTDSQFVGVSRTAPELSGDDVSAGHGALAGAEAGGGGAHSQVVLPRHKQSVQNYFNREE